MVYYSAVFRWCLTSFSSVTSHRDLSNAVFTAGLRWSCSNSAQTALIQCLHSDRCLSQTTGNSLQIVVADVVTVLHLSIPSVSITALARGIMWAGTDLLQMKPASSVSKRIWACLVCKRLWNIYSVTWDCRDATSNGSLFSVHFKNSF